jgi:PAS domain S-box-containing protein/putative nucleotidyltransferase with HDIG domain
MLLSFSQERSPYLTVLDDLGLPAFLVEGDLVVDLNWRMEKLIGWSHEEVIGKRSWMSFLSPKEDLEKLKQRLEAHLSGSSRLTSGCAARIEDRKGRVKEVILCASQLPGDEKFILTMRDVTAVKRAYGLLKLFSKVHSKRILGVRSRDEFLERFAEMLREKGYPEVLIHKEGEIPDFANVLKTEVLNGEKVKILRRFSRILNHGLQTMGYREALEEALQETIEVISYLVEVRDPYTAGHQRRVSGIACAIAKKMGLSEELIEKIRVAGLLHDVGKIGIPIDILNKPVPLSSLEFEMIKTHPALGYEIVSRVHFLEDVAKVILEHHERIDGSGYPQGLRREEISLEARILAVADVAEAMSSHRAYRPLLPKEEIVAEFLNNRGKLYDAQVVDAFLEFAEELPGVWCLEMEEFE